ncbi:MAG: restriction endonuclease subunit S [Enterococcus faecalis]|nr:restriction endonuclease subunit S [Enterococcus faecalis]
MRDEMKKVPRLRFRGFSEEWEQRKLDDVSEKVTEKNKNRKVTETLTNSAEYGIISQSDFFDKDISNINNIDGYYVVRPDDFVYNPRISNYAPVGPIKRNNLNKIGVMSPLYYVFRIKDIDPSFLEKYFDTAYWHMFMKLNGDSGARADRFAIKDSVFKQMPIPYPSIEEQVKLGNFFKQLDDTIALHQRKLEQLKELKKAYLQLMFPTKEERVPKLRFADFEGEWELCKLIGILDIIKGTQKSKSELSTNQNNCTPYPVYNGGINPSGYTNIYNRENAITISEGGNSAGFVNFVQEKFFSGGHNYTIVNNVTDTLFLFFYLCSIQEEIMRLRVGTGLPNIQKPTLMNLEIQKTTDNEQKFIGLFLKNIDILITLTQNKLNQLKSLKKSYLQNMFI